LREERRLRVFESRALRKIFGPKREEVKGERRQLRSEELNDRYFSPSIVRVIKWRRMRWNGHVTNMGERRAVYRVFVGKSEEDPDIDGRIILRWIFRKWDVGA